MTTHVNYAPGYSGASDPVSLRCPIVLDRVAPSNPYDPRNNCGVWYPVLRGACGGTVTLYSLAEPDRGEAERAGRREVANTACW